MAFRLKPRKSPTGKIVRIARQQLERAVAEAGATGQAAKERIHQARTRCKKIRALLRLIRPHDEEFYQRENARFRDTARPLSVLRDAEVMLGSLDRLLQQNGMAPDRPEFGEIHRRLLAHREKLLPSAEETERELARFARRMRRQTRQFEKLEGVDFKAIVTGLGLTYRRSRRAMRKAGADKTAESFHEWRKQAKYFRYQVRLLRRAWPPMMKKFEQSAETLSDLLGEEHDLGLLGRFIQGGKGEMAGPEASPRLIELIERRRGDVRSEALALGERLFVAKPSVFADEIAQWWKIARRQARAAGTGKD
ncbi:MAG TPA: CHAD domain-containing protein [Opitutaceae bacterium]|nr:CHAD domain-containing protein [Opitutaceae bacterium]